MDLGYSGDMKKFWEQYIDFVKRYIPEPQVKSCVGLDIGASSCKMVALKPKGSSYELLGWAIEPVKNNDVESAVRKVVSRCPDAGVAPVSALSGKGTLIRYVDMPRLSKEELRKSFAYEADKYLPFSMLDIYADCFILDHHLAGSKMFVMIAAAKKELVDQRVKLCSQLGIHPGVITLDPLALINVYQNFGAVHKVEKGLNSERNGVAILDMGDRVTTLNILVGDMPRFSRDISWGGSDVVKTIIRSLNVTPEEAEKLKVDPGERKAETLEAVESAFANLIAELRMSFDYFLTENNVSISVLLLTGGVSLFWGLQEVFKDSFDIQVELWDPFKDLELAPEVSRDELLKVSGQLGVALGLALYQ